MPFETLSRPVAVCGRSDISFLRTPSSQTHQPQDASPSLARLLASASRDTQSCPNHHPAWRTGPDGTSASSTSLRPAGKSSSSPFSLKRDWVMVAAVWRNRNTVLPLPLPISNDPPGRVGTSHHAHGALRITHNLCVYVCALIWTRGTHNGSRHRQPARCFALTEDIGLRARYQVTKKRRRNPWQRASEQPVVSVHACACASGLVPFTRFNTPFPGLFAVSGRTGWVVLSSNFDSTSKIFVLR